MAVLISDAMFMMCLRALQGVFVHHVAFSILDCIRHLLLQKRINVFEISCSVCVGSPLQEYQNRQSKLAWPCDTDVSVILSAQDIPRVQIVE